MKGTMHGGRRGRVYAAIAARPGEDFDFIK